MGGMLLGWLGCGRILSAVFVRFLSSPVLKVFSSLYAATERHGAALMAAVRSRT
jgi:hypothetical protein